MIEKKVDEIRHRLAERNGGGRRLDDDKWITINGTHVMVDKDGNLQGSVGSKIAGTSGKGKKSEGGKGGSEPKAAPKYDVPEKEPISTAEERNAPTWDAEYAGLKGLRNALPGLIKDSTTRLRVIDREEDTICRKIGDDRYRITRRGLSSPEKVEEGDYKWAYSQMYYSVSNSSTVKQGDRLLKKSSRR